PGVTINANTGLIAGALTGASVGTFNVTVTATDGTLTSSQGFTWTVEALTPFAQVNAAIPPDFSTSVPVPFTAPQSAGDLNVVVVGWNDSAPMNVSVTDTMGNTYVKAIG